MVSLRSEVRIDVPATAAWALVSDSSSISEWFPSIAACQIAGDIRTCTLHRGGTVRERIVNVDRALRRFQYQILEGIPVTRHLGTVDVLQIDVNQCLVVYSTEAEPDSVGVAIGSAVSPALARLKSHLESSAAYTAGG